MGSKYSSVSVSGFNSSPPSDDGSTASTNKVFWSTIKGKLADPLNTAIAAINSALVTATDYSARLVTSTDSTVAGDHMRTLEVPSAVTTTFTISLADAATMTNGYIVRVRNSSTVGITIGRATGGDTLDGAASNKLLPPGGSAWYAVNAAANGYITMGYSGPVQDTDAIVAGGTDGTKKVRLEVDGLTTATTRVMTVPDYDGTISTLAGTETLTNKTLTSPTINTAAAGGTWTAASTWTLPAFTLGGTVSLNGKSFSGTCADGGTFTTIDINGGTLDGVVIGGASAAAISGTTGTFSGLISANGGQIKFPASQSASADANTLDDYEEGTWTPSIGGTATYTTQVGTYTKIGRLVTVQGTLTVNSIGTGSTNTISGLPFAAAASPSVQSVSVGYYATLASNIYSIGGAISGSSSGFTLYGLTAASGTAGVLSVLQNGARVEFTASYIV